MTLPTDLPKNSPASVWNWQNVLLGEAEALLGPRDKSKKIYQPTFFAPTPRLINTPNFDGAYAQLSNYASGYWPTFIYELAHETVHLLNPTIGATNYLEEGIAVKFSLDMLIKHGNGAFTPSLPINYQKALDLVTELQPSCLSVAKILRKKFGALSTITIEHLNNTIPLITVEKSSELLKKFE
jgi:hypothetical protein